MPYLDKKNPRGLQSWDRETDRYWGWLTLNSAPKSFHPLGFEFNSGALDDGDVVPPRNYIRVSGFKHTMILTLPTWLSWLRPWREWVDTSTLRTYRQDGTLEERPPGSGYWNTFNRAYGIMATRDGGPGDWSPTHVSVRHGPSTMDSRTDHTWSCFLPWTNHRVVRHDYFDPSGALAHREPYPFPGFTTPEYEFHRLAVDAVPTARFRINDYDGEAVTVTTRIEEMEWRRGTGWWRWLGHIREPLIRRSLSLEFSTGVGRRKGSWKGGTLGHSTEMLPSDTPADAMRRYCEKHEMVYLGPQEELAHV